MKKKSEAAPTKLMQLLKSKDLEGLREGELKRVMKLTAEEAGEQALALEVEGKAVILNFAPLYLLSRESLQFLEGKILKHIEQYHAKHPDEIGVTMAKLEKRFDVPKRILTLALKGMTREGKIRETGRMFSAGAFEPLVTKAEEEMLSELEQVSLRGELDSGAIKSVQARHHISPSRMEKLLSLLVERKSVVQGKDDFYVNSIWLDEIVAKIRARESKELSVSDFKELTGLSRKYAIPLLELLDELNVTRRTGSTREILLTKP